MRGHSPSKTGVNALMTRASIHFANRWIAGSSPAMTTVQLLVAVYSLPLPFQA